MNWPELTPAMKELLVQAIASLAGALVGALAAFQLEARRQRGKEQQGRIDRLNKAIFSLGMQRNYLVNLKRQQLDPYREHPLRAFLPAVLQSPMTSSIEWTELTFLLNDPSQGDLLNRFALSDDGFRTVVGLVETRREMHSRFQERLDLWKKENPDVPDELGLALITRAVGMPLSVQLTNVTDHLYESVERALTANRSIYTRMTSAFVRLFPKKKHVKVEELEKPMEV